MVRAWYMDDKEGSQRLPHIAEPENFLDMVTVQNKTGIEYFAVNVDKYTSEGKEEVLDKLRKDRGYSYEDECRISEKMENYNQMLAKFYQEHLHTDEEIRLIADGSGYFDARDVDDKWIRIEVVRGDLLILPAGIYHRFTPDEKDFIVARRYFVGEPVWTPIPRPCDDVPARQEYVHKMALVY